MPKLPDPLEDPKAREAAHVTGDVLDAEDRRRLRSYRRRPLQYPREREAYMTRIAELDPALHAELTALRGASPQAWRKRLHHEARRLDLHTYFGYSARTADDE